MGITPDLFEMGLARFGIAAAQLKAIDPDTRKAFVRLIMTAVGTGDANGYLKERLAWIEARDSEPPPIPTRVVTSKVVEGSFEGEPLPRKRR